MNAVVTPSDVEAQVDDTENVDTNTPAPDEDGEPSSDSVAAVEDTSTAPPAEGTSETPSSDEELAAKNQRLAAFIEKWVPNKEIWPHLLEMKSPSVFDSKELPFPERTFIASWNAKEGFFGSIVDSIMLPYYCIMASVAFSTFNAFAAVIDRLLSANEIKYLVASLFSIFPPLILGFAVMILLHECPCRILLYHRLWERKIVVSFKTRTWRHPFTALKLIFLGGIIVFYFWYGYAELQAGVSFYLTVSQSFGTFAWVIYSSLSIDKTLIPINKAFLHARMVAEQRVALKLADTECEKSSAMSGPSVEVVTASADQPTDTSAVDFTTAFAAVNPSERLAATISQMTIVSETQLRYDILALRRALQHAKEDGRKVASGPGGKQKVNEKKVWLKVIAMWIGRLGHSRQTMVKPVGRFERELYGLLFIQEEDLYDDDAWHKFGSFFKAKNRSGFHSILLLLSFAATEAIIVLVVYAVNRRNGI